MISPIALHIVYKYNLGYKIVIRCRQFAFSPPLLPLIESTSMHTSKRLPIPTGVDTQWAHFGVN